MVLHLPRPLLFYGLLRGDGIANAWVETLLFLLSYLHADTLSVSARGLLVHNASLLNVDFTSKDRLFKTKKVNFVLSFVYDKLRSMLLFNDYRSIVVFLCSALVLLLLDLGSFRARIHFFALAEFENAFSACITSPSLPKKVNAGQRKDDYCVCCA